MLRLARRLQVPPTLAPAALDFSSAAGGGEIAFLEISNPASTYTYTIGAGGSGGSNGGNNAGNGGSGSIIVEEFY
jgi:hypothetical protein